MKIGDYVHGMAYDTEEDFCLIKSAVQGNIINLTQDIVVLWGSFDSHWFKKKQVIVAKREDCFDNHYDRDKKFRR